MDVKRLMQEPSAQVRGILAGKIAADYRSQQFNQSEMQIAQDIFRRLIKDAEISIRQSMALELAHCPHAPEDVVIALARDEHHAISTPVLEHSEVLSEDDLVSIVQCTNSALRLCAIARRKIVSQELAGSLMETGNGIVMQTLFRNQGAVINEENLLPLWKRLPLTEPLMQALVERGGLPMTIVEKIYYSASEHIKSQLGEQYPAYREHIEKAGDHAYAFEMLGIAPLMNKATQDEYEIVENMVDDLYHRGKLTHSLVIRSLCTGNVAFFECGMARLAEIPRVNARILMMDEGEKGFCALYQAASMPEGFYNAVCALMKITLEETQFGLNGSKDLRKRIVDRIYQSGYHRTIENMEYLLSIIGSKRPAGEHVH
jgi:uncharacterized protein (DUF2336 family)